MRKIVSADSFTVRSFDDAQAFDTHVRAFLLRAECENCIELGILTRMKRDAAIDGSSGPTMMLSIERGGEVALAAIQTPPMPLTISAGEADGAPVLAEYLRGHKWQGDLRAPENIATRLVDDITRDRTRIAARRTRLRVFKLERVIDPRATRGQMRRAMPAELDLAVKWFLAFADDCGLPLAVDALDASRRSIEEGTLFFWTMDGEPVSQAGVGGPTPNGIRVNRVYTPPALRGRGYASNLVATLSKKMLSDGRRFCFLFTDAQNPTSNGIYQSIGYRAVAESEHWSVSAGEEQRQ